MSEVRFGPTPQRPSDVDVFLAAAQAKAPPLPDPHAEAAPLPLEAAPLPLDTHQAETIRLLNRRIGDLACTILRDVDRLNDAARWPLSGAAPRTEAPPHAQAERIRTLEAAIRKHLDRFADAGRWSQVEDAARELGLGLVVGWSPVQPVASADVWERLAKERQETYGTRAKVVLVSTPSTPARSEHDEIATLRERLGALTVRLEVVERRQEGRH